MDSVIKPYSGSIVHLYKPTFYEVEGENIDSVVLTSEGYLIELLGNRIIASCELCPASTAFINLKTFYTYEPDSKYYLVQLKDQLFVIKKVNRNELQFQSVSNNISHFSTDDVDNLGQPKILVWTIGDTGPSVLNLYSDFSNSDAMCPKITGEALLKINAQAQALDSCLMNAQEILADKRMLVSRLSSPHSFSLQNELSPGGKYGIPLVEVLGEKSETPPCPKIVPISHGKPWLKIYSNIVVVGLFVSNLQERDLRSLELTGLNTSILFKKTVVFRTSKEFGFSDEEIDFEPSDFLPGYTHGFVTGFIKEPLLVQKTLILKIILSFSMDDNKRAEQLYVGDIHIAYEDLLSSTHQPFKESREVTDLLAVLMDCENTDIVYKSSEKDPIKKFKSTFIELGYFEFSERFFIHNFNKEIPLCLMLLKSTVEDGLCTLRIYFRRKAHLFLFVVASKTKLGPTWEMETQNGDAEDLKTLCHALSEEMKGLLKFFARSSLSSSDTLESALTVDSQILCELLTLEANSEEFFPLLESEMT